VFPQEDYPDDESTYDDCFTPGARPDVEMVSSEEQRKLVEESSAYQLAVTSDPKLVQESATPAVPATPESATPGFNLPEEFEKYTEV